MRKIGALLAVVVVAVGCVAARAEEGKGEFVRVSPRDPRYLETSDGRPYLPIGLNLIAPPWTHGSDDAGRLAGLDEWFGKLAANGGNYVRVWLSNEFYEIEHERAGRYDADRATRRIDAMLALARKHGIRVKMTLEHFREIDPAKAKQPWALNVLYHESKGGGSKSMTEWVDSPDARKQFVSKLEFFARRYKDEPAMYAWELWNEMNAINGKGDYMGWTRAMLPELHRLFPHHLCVQSLGSFDGDYAREPYRTLSTMPGNDVAQVHRYLDLGARFEVCHGPVDVLAADAVRELISYKPGRPVILAESGAVEPRHAGPFKLYAKDTRGVILHDVLFAPFFAGAAGAGQCWHWDQYVAANDLWWQFGRFAAAVKDLDPPAEQFEPATIEHDRLRVYVLKGKRTTLAWCKDKRTDWRTELADGKPPEKVSGAAVALGATGRVRVYDPWTNRWSEPKAEAGRVALPAFERDLVIRVER